MIPKVIITTYLSSPSPVYRFQKIFSYDFFFFESLTLCYPKNGGGSAITINFFKYVNIIQKNCLFGKKKCNVTETNAKCSFSLRIITVSSLHFLLFRFIPSFPMQEADNFRLPVFRFFDRFKTIKANRYLP